MEEKMEALLFLMKVNSTSTEVDERSRGIFQPIPWNTPAASMVAFINFHGNKFTSITGGFTSMEVVQASAETASMGHPTPAWHPDRTWYIYSVVGPFHMAPCS